VYDDYKFVTRKDLENLGETLLPYFHITDLSTCGVKHFKVEQETNPQSKHAIWALTFSTGKQRDFKKSQKKIVNCIPASEVLAKTVNQSEFLHCREGS